MTTSNERAELIEKMESYAKWHGGTAGVLLRQAAAMLAADGEAEPVAWAWGRRDANGEVYDCISDAEHALNEGKYTVPLYTFPPQQKQAAPGAVQDGYALAMAVLQSGLYHQLDDLERAQCDAMLSTAPMAVTPDGWQDISTAPKDGSEILVMCAGDDAAYVASWGEYPGNPVMSAAHEESWMYGWIFKNPYLHAGGHEEGFLGWDDDPMPTHWAAAPKQETVA